MTSNYKILLIEDNTDMRENIAEILELSGYQTLEAENGKEGVKLALKESPDLIICDVMMPVMDGFEALYILEKNDKTKHIPFIFLTAKSDNQDVRAGMNLGADDFLTKPFEEMDLLKAIETRLSKNENISSYNALHHHQLLSQEEISQFFENDEFGEVKNFKKKDIVFYEKDASNAVYWIKKGKIRLYKEHALGKEFTTTFMKSNDVLGFTSVVGNQPYSHSAICMDDTVCIKIPSDIFLEKMYTLPGLQQYLFKVLSQKNIQLSSSLVDLAYNSVRKRVADSLLILEHNFNSSNESTFSISIPRDELATMVGTSPESVIRVLSNFKADKIIEINGSEICILDKNRLAEVYH